MNPILSMLLGVLLYVLYFVNGYMNAPMTFPLAQRLTPGVSFIQLWQDRQEQYQKVDERNKGKTDCIGKQRTDVLWLIFGSPTIGYASIHREFIKDIPESSRGGIAPIGMFPDAEHANPGDYINAYWYAYQETLWWLEVEHVSGVCAIPHPSQTMNDHIKAAKKK